MDKFKRGQGGLILIVGIIALVAIVMAVNEYLIKPDCAKTPPGPMCLNPPKAQTSSDTAPSSNGQAQNLPPAQPPSNNPTNLMYRVTSTAPSAETCSPIGGQVVCNNGLVIINSCCLNVYNNNLSDSERQQVCDFAAGTGKPIAPCIDFGKSSQFCQVSNGKFDLALNGNVPAEDAVDCPITQPGSQSDVAVTVPTEDWDYHDGLSFDFYKTKNDGDFILKEGGQNQVVTGKVVQVQADTIPIEVHNFNDVNIGTITYLSSDCFSLSIKTIDSLQQWPLTVDKLGIKSLELNRVKKDFCPPTVTLSFSTQPGGDKAVTIDFTQTS